MSLVFIVRVCPDIQMRNEAFWIIVFAEKKKLMIYVKDR